MHPSLLEPVSLETAEKLGLNAEEFEKIQEFLARMPNFNELSMYAVMWSEHCSYKNSIAQIKTLPKTGRHVLAGAGEENAGLVDIGDGLAVAFKIESHNHPSAIEPYQGAATGVGGIHRDIFTMGARPIAALNSLRFGDPSDPKTQHLLRGVVRGIGGYGNSFGVPTVGGEIYFDPCYQTNPLVNAMSVGIVQTRKTASARADGPGNPVYIVGSATGKDGIHGATFASADITEESAQDLPAVQVGDPFQEKLLLEASLEVIDTGAVVGMQDMGAAGITCSTSEMSAKSQTGMDIHLDKAPQRQENMQPFELLLSESQERMLLVVQKGREAEVEAVFEKWDLPCVQIGEVTPGPDLRIFWHGELIAQMPADSLVLGGGAPVYIREQQQAKYTAQIATFNAQDIPEPANLRPVLRQLLQTPDIASKGWVARQYDSMVGAATVTSHQHCTAAVVNIRGTRKAIAMTVDCNARHVRNNPASGCAFAVAEAARNLVCTGARPLGITNCLNFGNPYNPEVYWQFAQAIAGMGEACRTFDLPVTGGNVSFYNQGPQGPVFPTPTIGMVGLLEDVEQDLMTLDFKRTGDLIYLLGPLGDSLAGSSYCYHIHGVLNSPAPHLNLNQEKELQETLLHLIGRGLLQSAQDVSDGGLLIALLESAFAGAIGFDVHFPAQGLRKDGFWLGETGARVVVSVAEADRQAFERALVDSGYPGCLIGQVGLDHCSVDGEDLGSVVELNELYSGALERLLNQQQAPSIA